MTVQDAKTDKDYWIERLRGYRPVYVKTLVETLSDGYSDWKEERRFKTTPYDATLISSQIRDSDKHHILLDLDVPHEYIPSSTPGHGHLMIATPVSWFQYSLLLRHLRKLGVLEDGFVKLSLRRGASYIRTPWVRK